VSKDTRKFSRLSCLTRFLGGEVKKGNQKQKYSNQVWLRNQVDSYILTAIDSFQGRLPPLAKSPCPD
jgi:hypothetical protein